MYVKFILFIMNQTSKKYLMLLYDNTFDGLLSSIFDVYRLKLVDFDINPSVSFKEKLFQPTLNVSTNKAKANRIKIGLKRKTGQNLLPYLQEIFYKKSDKEEVIFQLIQRVFYPPISCSKSHGTINT